MPKKILAFLALLITLARAGIVYPQTLIVNTVGEQGDGQYALSLRSATGCLYETITDIDDLAVGDVMATIMYCAGTPDDVRDDAVVAMRYSGFHQLTDQTADEVVLLATKTS